MSSICKQIDKDSLKFHSSEQYLMTCLKLCNLIVKHDCEINELVDFGKETALLATTTESTSLQQESTTTLPYENIEEFLERQLNYYFDYFYNIFPTRVSSSATSASLLFLNLNSTECQKYGHRESYKLSLFVCGIILCFLILILNGLTLYTIFKTKKLHSVTNILIANLSASDFLSGISFLYPCTLNLLTINALQTYNSNLYQLACNIRQYYYLCLVAYSPMICSMLSSVFTLTLLAIEKYIAIVRPYLYKRLISSKKYLIICLSITWSMSVLISLLPIMGWNEHSKLNNYRGFSCTNKQSIPCMFEKIFTLDYILLFTSICCLCAITMLFIYIKIYFVARKHSKQIAQMANIVSNTYRQVTITELTDHTGDIPITPTGSSDHSLPTSQQDTQTTKSFNLSMKALKTLLILLLGFYLCWLPLITYFLTFASQKYNNLTIYILMFIACCNAVIDPIVYAFRNRDFCKALILNFKCLNKTGTNTVKSGKCTNS